MGAIEIGGIGATMMAQGVLFDTGATMAAALLSLLGVAGGGILLSVLTSGRPRALAHGAGRPALAPAIVVH